jgi:hypothetical protein
MLLLGNSFAKESTSAVSRLLFPRRYTMSKITQVPIFRYFPSRSAFRLGRKAPCLPLASVNEQLAIAFLNKCETISKGHRHLSQTFGSSRTVDGVRSYLKGKQSWSELPKNEIELWTTLGWNESSWSNGPAPESEQKTWDQLSINQQNAARTLKSSMRIPTLHDPQWAKDSFDGAKHFDGTTKLWSELTEQQRGHWKVLGWEPCTWEKG